MWDSMHGSSILLGYDMEYVHTKSIPVLSFDALVRWQHDEDKWFNSRSHSRRFQPILMTRISQNHHILWPPQFYPQFYPQFCLRFSSLCNHIFVIIYLSICAGQKTASFNQGELSKLYQNTRKMTMLPPTAHKTQPTSFSALEFNVQHSPLTISVKCLSILSAASSDSQSDSNNTTTTESSSSSAGTDSD